MNCKIFRNILFVFLISIVLFSCRNRTYSSPLSIENMKCEYRNNPLDIDILFPRLSWQIDANGIRGEKQTAYRIMVASSRDKLTEGKADLWDSGRVQSDQSINVSYKGRSLETGMHCFWKVMIWDKEGKPANWSKPASWSMGLLDTADWKAQWIGTPEANTSPFFRRSFSIEKLPKQATIYIASLGYFELYVNGQKIGNEVLSPAVSNFSKRSYYRTYDVSQYLKQGLNNLGIHMGTGWYSNGLPGVKHHSPVVRAQLELTDNGQKRYILTDTSWESKPSERKLLGTWSWGNFGGEQLDARLIDNHWWDEKRSLPGWSGAVEADVADVPCSAQTCSGNTSFDTLIPKSMHKLNNKTILVDFGTNLTGMMQMSFHALNAGDTIRLFYSDKDARENNFIGHKMKDGFSDMGQYDAFISAGNPKEAFRNVFNYHAFRYVLIDGLSYMPDRSDIEALPIETTVKETGTFSCSNDLYNRIHKMVRWTYRCLNLGGQTVDCPHRERLGYGDGQTIMDLGLYNFDAVSLYAKWSRNWWDEQTEDGFVPFTAPCPHSTGGGPAWGAMCIMVPWKTYLFSGDCRLLEEGYPYMKKYVAYLDSHCKDGSLQDIFPAEKWPNLGDWVPPGRGMEQQDWVDDRSRLFFNNCYRVHLLQIMQEVAGLLDKECDREAFKQQSIVAQKKIHEAWFNPQDTTYANGEQPYLIFPLKTGVTPERLKEAVFRKYVKTLLVEDNGHLNTGMIGTQIMTDYLIETGRNDLVDVYTNQKTYPGWGYMIENGASTCWEQWNGNFSQIHSCFPYIGGWFFKGLAGIQWDAEAPGFKNVILRPGLVKSVDWVKCSYESPYGSIVSNWKLEGNLFQWDITIPANSTATVHLPGKNIKEGNFGISESMSITYLYHENNSSVYKLESGNYFFTCML